METWFPVIIFGIFALLFVTALVTSSRNVATLRREFPAWAATLGWSAKPMTGWRCSPEASGNFRDRTGRAYTYTAGSEKSRAL